jgi:hypothetical protein
MARTLKGIRGPAERVAWVSQALDALGAAQACDVLSVVLSQAEARDELYGPLMLMVSVALHAETNGDLRRAIAGMAAIRKRRSLEHLLYDAPEGPSEDARTSVVPDFGKGRPVSLGERKTLARTRDRQLIDRVLRDPDPDVIRILLKNPALTEENVVRLCSLRPVAGAVLDAVFIQPQWVVRYRVRLALALNPHTPETIGLQLVPHLTPADRKAVGQTAQISERVRAACERRPESEALH